MTTQFKSDLNEKLALVVFGRDDAGKAHASSFTEGDAKLAEKAAGLMKLRVLQIRTEAEQALAARVPRGRVFASGKAFVPFVKPTLFLELQNAALNGGMQPLRGSVPPPTRAPAAPQPAPAPARPAEPSKSTSPSQVKQPCGWADIEIGAIVLTMDPPSPDWFEAEVIAIQGDDLFTLRWRDWPELPPVVRRRVQLALMHPARPKSAA